MKMRVKLSALLMAVALCAIPLAGCSGSSGESASTPGSAASQVTQPSELPSSEPTAPAEANMRFMWWGSDSRHEATIAVIESYQAANPGVVIDAEYGGYDGYFEKLTTQLSSGTAADIIQFDANMTTDLLRIGDVFVDVNSMGDYIDISGFDAEFLKNFCVQDGEMVGLPTGITAGVLLTNTAVTEAAGIDVALLSTWDDVIAAGEKLQAHNPEQYLINYELITVGKELVYTCLAQLTGKEAVSPDLTANFTRDDLLQVFTLIDRLYSSGTLQPAEEGAVFDSSPQTNPKWISHDFATGFLITSFINPGYYDFQDTADIVVQPAFPDAKESGAILRPAQIIGVSSGCPTPEAAFRFLDYFYNDEQAARTLKDVRSIPPTENARKICTEEGLLDEMAVKGVNLTLPIATQNQNLAAPNDISQIFQDGAAKIAYKQGTVEAITDETMSLVETTLERLKS